ncbi:DUF2500 domain-containing protein [Paenibacillus taiwanensis]|uniref:DUF2500 domain-containing protein n=1 Tax=Paenibacillus taiwanensis TaxID=401638 RepID=UPI00042643B1|nr:DUF2500 domain-containing protein [Paenibacillus taiwanensis]
MGPESEFFSNFFLELPWFFKLFGGIVIIMIASVIFRGIRTWSANNAAEQITQSCKVIDKRSNVWGGSGDSQTSTQYYVTFEFEDQSRLELPVSGEQYGLTVVGDRGNLTYQGTRFKSFSRVLEG